MSEDDERSFWERLSARPIVVSERDFTALHVVTKMCELGMWKADPPRTVEATPDGLRERIEVTPGSFVVRDLLGPHPYRPHVTPWRTLTRDAGQP